MASRLTVAFGTTATIGIGSVIVASSPASADPSADTWYQLRMCESTNTYSINTGNGYYGAYQFDLSTWQSVGGSGYPNNASPAEQDYRALYLYRMRGWEPWTCARILGLREDSDGGSGRAPGSGDFAGGGSGGTPTPTKPPPEPPKPPTPPTSTGGAPAWPGQQYYEGDYSANLKKFQLQLKKRGADFDGTGWFGAKTEKYVKGLQRANGLGVVGFIGPKTWATAWTGKMPTASQLNGGAGPSSTPTNQAPAWPGITFSYGDSSPYLKKWQLQMRKRGYPFDGTGNFGPKTLKYVKKVQADNGLHVVGYIGPKTWAAAWTGK